VTDIKICGISTVEALDAAIAAGASHVGFVFFAASPRHVTPALAAGLAHRVPARVTRVGVFVDPDDALLDAAVAGGLDAIQLHGREDAARIAAVKARYRLPVWRAAGVATRADIDAAAAAAGSADLLLFDAKAPTGATLPGGNGVRFDWQLLGRGPARAWGLSGGLDAASVGAAIRGCRPALVDVSSGVEDAPGVKSIVRIQDFIEAVRAA